MKIRYLFALILVFLVSAAAVAQEDSDSSPGSDFAGDSSEGSSDASAKESSGGADLQGIWRFSLAETEVTVALSQSGDSLYGSCKFEGDNPWNGVVSGSVSGRAVHIALAALQGKVLVSTSAEATFQDDSLTGSYVKADSEGNAALGELTAMKISADISDYTPAKVESQAEAAPETAARTRTTPAADEAEEGSVVASGDETASAEETRGSSQESVQTAQLGSRTQTSSYKKAQYHNVNDLAKGLDPNIMPRSYPL